MCRAMRKMKWGWNTVLMIFALVVPASASFVHPYCTDNCTGLPTGQYGDCHTCHVFVYCDHGNQRQASCPKDYGPTYYDWSIGVCAHYPGSSLCPPNWKPAPRASESLKTSETTFAPVRSDAAGGGNQETNTSQGAGNEKSLTGSTTWGQQAAGSYTGGSQPVSAPVVAAAVPPPTPGTTTTTSPTRVLSTASAPTTTTESSTRPSTATASAVTTTTTTATTAPAATWTAGQGVATRATTQKSCGTPCHPQCPAGPKAQVYVRCGDCCYIECSPEGKLTKEACPHPNSRLG